jgi:hypothetical protein
MQAAVSSYKPGRPCPQPAAPAWRHHAPHTKLRRQGIEPMNPPPLGPEGHTVNKRWMAGVACAASLTAACGPAAATTFNVSFIDPGAQYTAYYASITQTLAAAGQDWLSHFVTAAGASLEVQIAFDPQLPTAQGTSATSGYVGMNGAYSLWAQGLAYELKTGLDPNGSAPDMLLIIGSGGYLQSTLWFDSLLGSSGAGAVPPGQTDAYTVFAHEFGHALGFNGWRDGVSGALPGDYQSTFDALVQVDGSGGLVFVGTQAMALFGGPVPLAWGNYGHLGSFSMTGDGRMDLMNGYSFTTGTRYEISSLDLAVMADIGMTLSAPLSPAPEPAQWALTLAGLAALAWLTRRRSLSGSRARG